MHRTPPPVKKGLLDRISSALSSTRTTQTKQPGKSPRTQDFNNEPSVSRDLRSNLDLKSVKVSDSARQHDEVTRRKPRYAKLPPGEQVEIQQPANENPLDPLIPPPFLPAIAVGPH